MFHCYAKVKNEVGFYDKKLQNEIMVVLGIIAMWENPYFGIEKMVKTYQFRDFSRESPILSSHNFILLKPYLIFKLTNLRMTMAIKSSETREVAYTCRNI